MKELWFQLTKVYYWLTFKSERRFFRYIRSLRYVQERSQQYLNKKEMMELAELILTIVRNMKRDNIEILDKLRKITSFIDKDGVLNEK